LNADIEPRKKDRLGLPSPKAIPEPTFIRVTAFGPAFQSDINPRATRDLQYIGPFGSDSHPQIFIGVSQKGSHSRSYSTESNPEAENEVYKNSDAHLRCSHEQAYENTVIGDGTILVNEKGQPVGVSLIRDFTAPATNIEVQIPSGTSSGGQAQSVPLSSNASQNPFRRSIRFRRALSYYGKDGINAVFAIIEFDKGFKEYSDIFLSSISPDSDFRKIMHYVFAIAIQFQKSRSGKLGFKPSLDEYEKGFEDHNAPN
jgi:hypothetical protein